DMLHVGVLPHHDRWGDVLSNLRYVIVDEAHVYRGVFGSHVANVLRRLRRLARIYGAEPQFLLASATIANPGELVDRLLGVRATVVGDDGAPRAERTVVLWNPPLTDEALGLRASPLGEGSRVLGELVSRNLRTLLFAKSRKAAELIHRFAADRLGDSSRLSPYRAGYTPAQRREIEQRLSAGDLLGVSATNALELGIDVGLLDAVVSVGFPGTVSSLPQQVGRDYPAARVPLRSTGMDAFTVVDHSTGSVLGLVEHERAYSTVHDGAIYLHLGEQFRVVSLDLEVRAALVEPFSGDYYTQAKKETMTAIDQAQRAERRLGLELSFGTVVVSEQVVAYQRKSNHDQAALDLVQLDLPQTEFETEAIWFVPEPWMTEDLDSQRRLLGSLHAAEHSLIALLPLWAMCDRWDIGGLSTNVDVQTGAPTIFVYDGHAGGVGITERGFEAFEGWVEDTAKMLRGCPCLFGCPSCIQSSKCGNLNEPLDKAGALAVLERMLSSRRD